MAGEAKPIALALKLAKELNPYRHLFFDLDHTLWDFETNSKQTLRELFVAYCLQERMQTNSERFIQRYSRENSRLWRQYRKRKIQKDELRLERFRRTFQAFGISELSLIKEFEAEYLNQAPQQTVLMPGTLPILQYLQESGYHLHIITNGFQETQLIKLKSSGLTHFFGTVLSSEEVQKHKPDPGIFREALRRAGANLGESLMIGDNIQTDIRGAKRIGMAQVYYNPQGQIHRERVTHEINDLLNLRALL